MLIGFEIPIWIFYWLPAMLVGPVLVPVIAGVVCGGRMDWISPQLGFVVGIGAAALIGVSYSVFMLIYRERIFPDSEFGAGAAFGSLSAVIIAQVLVVVGICWLVNHRRGQNWGIRRW